ncbi:MAG: hypothetical protein WD002_12545 [Pseudomonadales bacterium]
MSKTTANQNPEQKARDRIDRQLTAAGWAVQDKKAIDFTAAPGIAVREYQTDVGPADYVLFVDKQAVGVIEAKPEDWGHKITTVERQSQAYASANLKWVNNSQPLAYVYESTGIITRFTDGRDPAPRSREIFNFHRPETLAEWLSQPDSLRARLQQMPALNTDGLRNCQITAINNLEKSFKQDRPRALVQMAAEEGNTDEQLPQSHEMVNPSAESCYIAIYQHELVITDVLASKRSRLLSRPLALRPYQDE